MNFLSNAIKFSPVGSNVNIVISGSPLFLPFFLLFLPFFLSPFSFSPSSSLPSLSPLLPPILPSLSPLLPPILPSLSPRRPYNLVLSPHTFFLCRDCHVIPFSYCHVIPFSSTSSSVGVDRKIKNPLRKSSNDGKKHRSFPSLVNKRH